MTRTQPRERCLGRSWAALDALPRRLLSLGLALVPAGLLDGPIHRATAQKYLACDHPAFCHQWASFDPDHARNTGCTWLVLFFLIGARLALAHKLFHARNLDFDAFAEILNPGKGRFENEFAAIMAMNRIGVAHAGSSGPGRLVVGCVDIDPVEGGQNVLPAETIRTGWPNIGNAIRTDNGTYTAVSYTHLTLPTILRV